MGNSARSGLVVEVLRVLGSARLRYKPVLRSGPLFDPVPCDVDRKRGGPAALGRHMGKFLFCYSRVRAGLWRLSRPRPSFSGFGGCILFAFA